MAPWANYPIDGRAVRDQGSPSAILVTCLAAPPAPDLARSLTPGSLGISALWAPGWPSSPRAVDHHSDLIAGPPSPRRCHRSKAGNYFAALATPCMQAMGNKTDSCILAVMPIQWSGHRFIELGKSKWLVPALVVRLQALTVVQAD